MPNAVVIAEEPPMEGIAPKEKEQYGPPHCNKHKLVTDNKSRTINDKKDVCACIFSEFITDTLNGFWMGTLARR